MNPGPVGLILLAAGSSQRMAPLDKLWEPMGGQPIICWSLRALHSVAEAAVLVVREDTVQRARDTLAVDYPGLSVVVGGAQRQQSVARGLEVLRDLDVVCVHDCARPFVTEALLRRGLTRLGPHDGAIPVLPVSDTIKQVDRTGLVKGTLDRGALRAVQTPQIFRGASLREAHARAQLVDLRVTDDAALLEACGMSVTTFEGQPDNFKVTTAFDLRVARMLAGMAA